MKALALWAGILGGAGFGGILALSHPLLALPLAGLLLAASVVALKGDLPDRLGNHRWIPYAWIALMLAANFRFTFTNTLDPSTSTTTENKIQLLVYLTVAILVVHSRRPLVEYDRRRIRKGLLLAWPLLAVTSALWSPVPLFTVVRSLQLLVPVGLAVLMARIWLVSPATAEALWKKTLHLFVQAVTILAVWGLAVGGWRGRFTWPGAHAITASSYLAIALLILLACRRAYLGFGMPGYVFRLILLVLCLYLGETRGTFAALLVAVAVLLWFQGRQAPLTRYLGIMYYGTALLLILLVALPQVVSYLERGGDIQTLATLNGRIGLWEVSIDLVDEANKWATGFGYASARVFLPLYVTWDAGAAHSSWVELLLGTGMPGILLLAADVLFLFRYLLIRRSIIAPALSLSLLAFLLIHSTVSELLVFPGLGFGILALLHVPVLVQLNWRSETGDARLLVTAPRTPMNLQVDRHKHDDRNPVAMVHDSHA